MLVTTATSGVYSSSEPSLSSASATKQSPLPWWALVPASPRSPPTANDGSNPQCCNATMSIDVVVVLPCVPVTISVVWPSISLASTTGRRITGMPRRRASTSSGLVFGIAAWVVTTAVGPPGSRSSDDASWPIRIAAPRARSAATPRDSLASEPDTSPPRSSRMRAMPDMPAPPMPTMCTRCSSAAALRRSPQALSTYRRARRRAATSATRLRGVAVSGQRRGRRHRRQPRRCRRAAPTTVSATKSGRQVGVVDHQPAAGVDHGQRVEPLLAVADRQRHVHRGQADGGHLGDRHRAGPADRQVGGGVREIHPVQVRHRDVRRIDRRPARAGRACSSGRARAAPRYPPRQGLRRQPATARLSDCAPCEPPNTSSTRASSAKPKWARASARSAIRSSEVIAARTGTPTTSALPQTRVGHGREHAPRRAGADPVGPARAGVGLVDHHRHPASPPRTPRAAR